VSLSSAAPRTIRISSRATKTENLGVRAEDSEAGQGFSGTAADPNTDVVVRIDGCIAAGFELITDG
jgi:hypothetical protein